MARASCDQIGLRAGRCEQRDVAGHQDDVEGAAEIEGAEVGDSPVEIGRESSRGAHHRCVGVDTDHRHAAASKLTSSSSGAASGVEHGRGREPHDEVGFTMDVNTFGSQRVESLLILVAVPRHPPHVLRSITRHAWPRYRPRNGWGGRAGGYGLPPSGSSGTSPPRARMSSWLSAKCQRCPSRSVAS